MGLSNYKEGRLLIDPTCCQSDCCAFEKAVRKAKECENFAQWSETRRYLEEAKALYQGEYLPMFRNEECILEKREALHRQFLWVEERLKNLMDKT